MPVNPLLFVGGGGLLFGLGWLLLGSGGGGGGGGQRPPYTTEIPIPPQGVTWEQVDVAMCLAYEAGARTGEELLHGVLQRLWPDVPWPVGVGDSHSTRDVQQLVGVRVGELVQRIQAGEEVCAGEKPKPAEVIDDITPWFTNEPGGFYTVAKGSSPTLAARGAYNLGASETGRIKNALSCMVTTGFNLLFYSRRRDGNDYGRGTVDNKWYDMGQAWNPVNRDAAAAAASHQKLLRNISWSGATLHNGTYGAPWLPPMKVVGNALICEHATWAPERNPPAEVLQALGWTLEGMKAAWDARPNTG